MEKLYDSIYMTFVYQDRWLFFWDGLWMTLLLSVSSFVLGTLVGALLCALRLSGGAVLRRCVNTAVQTLMQLPTLVLLMVFVYIVFDETPLAVELIVILGLTLKAGAYLCDIFHSAVTSVSRGELEAAQTLCLSRWQIFRYIMLPQGIDAALPVYKNQFVITLQETSIVGYLAIMDLTRASEIVTSRTLDALFSLIVISVLYLIIGALGNRLLSLLGHRRHLGGEDR